MRWDPIGGRRLSGLDPAYSLSWREPGAPSIDFCFSEGIGGSGFSGGCGVWARVGVWPSSRLKLLNKANKKKGLRFMVPSWLAEDTNFDPETTPNISGAGLPCGFLDSS